MIAADAGDVLSGLPALPRRSSTAEYAADELRRQIADGKLPPGTKLREESVSEAFGISRNTVREAFRLLAHEQLVEHELHRGVHVRTLSAADVRDLYATRRLVQPLGVDTVIADPARLSALRERVDTAVAAAARGDWHAVGTADIDFHRVLVAGCRSTHIVAMFERVLAELRLAFLQLPDRRELHLPYVERNRRIAELLSAGDRAGALSELRDYLDTAERHILGVLTAESAG
ncbi:GntR family transcriptional regulator [Pseudonocardia humida]|uniref:GntR family transcriptional regulator n=1 Tax=Pseudonocardia humida TaxID=2800819 RepID=A0ABT0ZUC8_9PSEU|nr:GntR family transcriptional regulator [Pseudonocardia humida]MCO1654341.1 GntR family transcriptional regulator [Pseudonocardia humida]